MKIATAIVAFLLLATAINSQNVEKKVKDDLKRKRFIEAMNIQYVRDSIWFYEKIEESYAVSNTDTTYWILKTPRLLQTHTFQELFDTTISVHTEIDSTVNLSYLMTWSTSSGLENNYFEFDSASMSWENKNYHKTRKKQKRHKKKSGYDISFREGSGSKYYPYSDLIGYFPFTSDITPDSLMTELPAAVIKDNTGYLVIRCDDRQALKILRQIRLTEQIY